MNVFFYDGNCSFCTKLAGKLKSLCLKEKIQFCSFRVYSESELKSVHKDLNYDLLSGNVQYIYAKKRYPGFFALRKLCPDLKGYRYFFWIFYLPLIPFLGMLIFYLIKKFK
jgi:predicted DCC family thiol-disulfide oxidoreductase YuxK